MLRAFVEVDRATMGPERLAVKLGAYARLHTYVPTPIGRPRPNFGLQPLEEDWKRRYALFPRLLLSWTAPAPPASPRAFKPCAQPPGQWRCPASCATSLSWQPL
jgi:hypothetical protein